MTGMTVKKLHLNYNRIDSIIQRNIVSQRHYIIARQSNTLVSPTPRPQGENQASVLEASCEAIWTCCDAARNSRVYGYSGDQIVDIAQKQRFN